ncbi:MAG: transposase [Myxococcota bacterium]
MRHRFGGALNLNVHAHALLLDGGYHRDASGALRFEPTAEPSGEEVKELAETIPRRLVVLLKRRGLLPAHDDDTNESAEVDALRACGRLALSVGRRERCGPALSLVGDDEVEQPRGGVRAVVGGVNVYASAAIADRDTLERVARYLLRGPLALGRLKMRPDGMLTYRLKKADRRGNTVLVLSPLELMARLSSLIPAPGHPTRRLFGILAPGPRPRPGGPQAHAGQAPVPPRRGPGGSGTGPSGPVGGASAPGI